MRVVGGLAGGIPLRVPTGDIRPTMDLVRGAIFSSLGEVTMGASVLDIFAGCGSLGIEALSRGARQATFVEKEKKNAEVIRVNLEKARLANSSRIVVCDASKFLISNRQQFDLIFADPPYTKKEGDFDFAAALLADPQLLAALLPTGILVLECDPRRIPPAPSGLEIYASKRYGKTAVCFWRHSE